MIRHLWSGKVNTKLAGIVLTVVTLISSGCASMSGDECLTSDWRGIGYEDGARGYSGDRLGQHRKACAKHGVTPDLEAYQTGRTAGLREFCQPQRGFNLGASGGRYNGVCAYDQEADFLDAYRTGSQLHSLRSDVNSASSRINSKEREMDSLADSVRDAEAGVIASETSIQDRILLLADLKDYSERAGQLEAEREDLIEQRAISQRELDSYEAVLADTGY
jgi:hypothetical protein